MTDTNGVLRYFEKVSRRCSRNWLVVRPLACTSPSNWIAIVPSDLTIAFVERSGSPQTLIASTSSGPMTSSSLATLSGAGADGEIAPSLVPGDAQTPRWSLAVGWLQTRGILSDLPLEQART